MNELNLLILSAGFLGFIHTLLGPDHYLPFIVLSRARNWTQSKTLWITFVSGLGHVGGSVILGIIGIALGVSLTKLETIESSRGDMVGWLIIAFGIAYSIYGIYKFMANGGHAHLPKFMLPKRIRSLRHLSFSGEEEEKEDTTKLTPWILFLIFVFGPCEVLIPLLIFPASEFSGFGILVVSFVFGLATISTMLLVVYFGYKGASVIQFKKGEKYFHLLAGLVILISGLGMQFLGW